MTEIYLNLCENKPIQQMILITTTVTHDTQLEWYACYAAGTQLVRSRSFLVRIGTHCLVCTGTHWYASGKLLVRIWYASGTHLLLGTHQYAAGTQLVRKWYAAVILGTHLGTH